MSSVDSLRRVADVTSTETVVASSSTSAKVTITLSKRSDEFRATETEIPANPMAPEISEYGVVVGWGVGTADGCGVGWIGAIVGVAVVGIEEGAKEIVGTDDGAAVVGGAVAVVSIVTARVPSEAKETSITARKMPGAASMPRSTS